MRGAEPVEAHRPTVPEENFSMDRQTEEFPKQRSKYTHVNIIGKVEPGVSGEGGAPLFNTTNHPDEVAGV